MAIRAFWGIQKILPVRSWDTNLGSENMDGWEVGRWMGDK
jgi:hypothetical protein